MCFAARLRRSDETHFSLCWLRCVSSSHHQLAITNTRGFVTLCKELAIARVLKQISQLGTTRAGFKTFCCQFLERGLLRSANFTQPSDLCVMSLCEIAYGRSGLLVRPVPHAKFVKQLGNQYFAEKERKHSDRDFPYRQRKRTAAGEEWK